MTAAYSPCSLTIFYIIIDKKDVTVAIIFIILELTRKQEWTDTHEKFTVFLFFGVRVDVSEKPIVPLKGPPVGAEDNAQIGSMEISTVPRTHVAGIG